MEPYAIFFGCWLCLFLGHWLTERKWRANADTYIRIESGGRIYKVSYADTQESENDPKY